MRKLLFTLLILLKSHALFAEIAPQIFNANKNANSFTVFYQTCPRAFNGEGMNCLPGVAKVVVPAKNIVTLFDVTAGYFASVKYVIEKDNEAKIVARRFFHHHPFCEAYASINLTLQDVGKRRISCKNGI